MNVQSAKRFKIGISTRLILFLLTINYIGHIFKRNYSLIFSTIPLFTVSQLEVWRIITGFFTSDSSYEYLINVLITIIIFNHWENKEGTSKHSIILLVNILIFQSSMLMIYLIVVWFFPLIFTFSIKALPCLGIAFLVKHLLLTNTKMIEVYPGIILNDRMTILGILIGTLFLGGFELRIEMFFCFYYGFLMCKFPKIYEVDVIDEETLLHFEKNEKYKGFISMDSWIVIDDSFIRKQRKRSSNGNINITVNTVDEKKEKNNDNSNDTNQIIDEHNDLVDLELDN